jgi:MFS family permease
MKFKFKRGLVPICINYFFLFLGLGFSLPYMTLQMMSLGLTLADASLINGLGPFIGFFFAPILGYAADKLGYKLVLISSILLFIASTTALIFLPVYRHHRAKIGLDKTMYNGTLEESFDSNSIV